jgi:hypothetical protein
MPNQPTSFRYPFDIPEDVHPSVRNALRITYNGVKDLNDAIKKLNTKVNANTVAVTTVTNTIVEGGGGSGPAPTPTPPLFFEIAVTVPAAAVLTLKASPVQLLAAPGVGSMYGPCLVTYQYKFGTTPYTIDGAFDQYLCVFSGPQPTVANARNSFTSILADGFMDQSVSQIFCAGSLARGPQTSYDNGALSIGLPSDCVGELTTGDGTLTITAEYAVVTLT